MRGGRRAVALLRDRSPANGLPASWPVAALLHSTLYSAMALVTETAQYSAQYQHAQIAVHLWLPTLCPAVRVAESLRKALYPLARTVPSIFHFLLAPIMASSLRAATAPKSFARFVPRCGDCIRDRYCTGCHKWWCESCYQKPGQGGFTEESSVVILSEGGTVSPIEETWGVEATNLNIKVRNGLCQPCSVES